MNIEKTKVEMITQKDVLSKWNLESSTTGSVYYVASLTDDYLVGEWTEENKENLKQQMHKLLEVRVFHADEERKCFRTDISKEKFYYRSRKKPDADEENYFEETQLLDTSLRKVKAFQAKAVRIRYYLSRYESTGQARIEDWSIVGFEGVK